jgi:hypothetical protein
VGLTRITPYPESSVDTQVAEYKVLRKSSDTSDALQQCSTEALACQRPCMPIWELFHHCSAENNGISA